MKQISGRMTRTEIQIEMEIQTLRVRVGELEQSLAELRSLLDATIGVGKPVS